MQNSDELSPFEQTMPGFWKQKINYGMKSEGWLWPDQKNPAPRIQSAFSWSIAEYSRVLGMLCVRSGRSCEAHKGNIVNEQRLHCSLKLEGSKPKGAEPREQLQLAELPGYSEKKIPTLCTSRLLRSRLNRLAERAVRLLSIEKLGPAGLSAGAPEKARGLGRRRDHGVGELARPWGGQHIENSCSRFDVLRKPILRARKKEVVM